ncbi:ABC transporter ATP-binding protein [Pseudoalteromonas piscicida]|uniref:ABC transporter ATP-binding protein n=1 Tax=Pseudoalteromonas piscicida TaxID=43662 RepID=A0AAD0RRU9_PSEO7|nr:ABC transporter ATP-binding protein [Pseudoalteromonas piscicida]ASD68454.1 methionine ABC transporter ATP-binding protein [Pseudoalteromonas piscicida]AXQ96734.1 ABC transporter ATP-binding protein [Pseudoalteromonas piscicida]AXR03503.1 ABC transporter ATP-binding protein [Pseudoalteromonas piscicida]
MLTISQLQFTWPKSSTVVLTIPKLHIARGEHVFLHGPSGSGKSTLLGLIAGTLDCQQGEIEIAGTNASALSRGQRDKFRADHIGTIFQNFNLLPYLSPIENVTLGCEFSKKRRQNISSQNKSLEQEAKLLLTELGIDEHTQHRSVAELSIGQQQRVAAARAFIGRPEIIIADEPTSALDADSRDGFIKLLFNQAAVYSASILFVSHDKSLAPLFDRQISLPDLQQGAPLC